MNLGFDCTLLPAVSGAETFSPFLCQLCNKFYQRPLLLPCSHSFCEKCIYNAAFRNYNKFVCRRCQTICDITKDQVRYNRDLTNALRLVGPINTSHLWVDFKIRCMSHGGKLTEASHSSGLLKKWLCLPCSRLVCQKCTSAGGDHADHKVVPAISHVDFDAIYMEALKAAFAYNVVQQTSDELFWLLEDLKTATAKLQDYCESYYSYVDENVSLSEGCLETLAMEIKKQVCRQALEKRRRLHRCTKLATELMAEARRREAHGNILLEPLDPIRSPQAYNEAQKWLLYWVASPPPRAQLLQEYPIPNPIGTKQSQSTTSSEGKKRMKHKAEVIQPPKLNVEVLVDTCVSKFQKRVTPIGSNRPSCRGSSDMEENVEINNKKATNSDTRELLTGIQLPLHQQLTAPIRSSNRPAADRQSPTDSLIIKENEPNSYLQTSHLLLENTWPASKVDFDKCDNLVNQSGRHGSNENDIVQTDVKTPTTPISFSPIGTKRPSARNKTANDSRLEMTLAQLNNNYEKTEVLAGIQLPMHKNISCLSGSDQIFFNSEPGSEAQKTPLKKSTNCPQKMILCSSSNSCVSPPNVNSLDIKTNAHEDKQHEKALAGGITEDQCVLSGVSPLPINLIPESTVGLNSYQSTAKEKYSIIDGKEPLMHKEDAIDLVNEKKLKTQSESSSVDGSIKRNQSSQLGMTTDVHYIPHSIRESTRKLSDVTTAELCNACSIEDIPDKNVRKFILNINDNENDSLITAVKDETNESTKIKLNIDGNIKLLVDDQCNSNNNESPIQHIDKKLEENSIFSSSNVMVDITGGDKAQDGNIKNEMAHTYQEVNQQACAKDTDEASTCEQNLLGENRAHFHQQILQYNRDELLKIGEHAHLKDNKFGGSKNFESRKKPCKKKKTKVSIDNDRSSDTNCADIKEMSHNDEMRQSSFFEDCIGEKDSITSETVDAEKILEGLACSFVRMAWDTVESILLELRFVHSDVNWAELWHLLVTAARPDAEYRLHPTDGVHCVTTRVVHLLHIAPLLDPRRLWANWGHAHPCSFHQDRLSKYYRIQFSSGNIVPDSNSLFQTSEKNDFSMHSSKNVEINIIKPEAISGVASILQGKPCIFPEHNTERAKTDDSSVLKSRAYEKMSVEAHPVKTWAELVSGTPRVQCCEQSHRESIEQKNRSFTYSPSASLTFLPSETMEGPCGRSYMSRSIVDELLHELAISEHEHKSKPNSFLPKTQSKLWLNDATLTPEQYRMHCLLNDERVDLGPCTNPRSPNLNFHTLDHSDTPNAINQTGWHWSSGIVNGSSQPELLDGTNFSSMPLLTLELPSSEFQTNSASVLSDDSLIKHKVSNTKSRNKCSQLHDGSNFGQTDLITESIYYTKYQNRNVDHNMVPKLSSTSCAGKSGSENMSHCEKQLVSALTSKKNFPNLKGCKNFGKSKKTLTLADWISSGHPKINKPIVSGGVVGRHHCRDSVSSDNELKNHSLIENLPKGAMRQHVTWNARSQKSKGLRDQNKPQSCSSSADQTQRVLQPKLHVSKAKIRKEKRKLRQSQKKPWSTAVRSSCDQRYKTNSITEESGEKEKLCTEESPDDKTLEDSEDGDLSTEFPPLDQSKHVECKDEERSEQESDEEWSVSGSRHIKRSQGGGNTSQDQAPEALKQVDDRKSFGMTIVGELEGSEVSPSCSTASVTPELLDFFCNLRKGRLRSSKPLHTDQTVSKKHQKGLGSKYKKR